MTDIIRGLHGHHELQEEAAFHSLMPHARPSSTILELGAWWAYYPLWFLGAVTSSEAICVEPLEDHLHLAKENLRLNGRSATIIPGCVGDTHGHVAMPRSAALVECFSAPALFQRIGWRRIELLHMDVQGAELPFLRSMRAMPAQALVRFVYVSTHHESISGSPDTHAECMQQLKAQGAAILPEHGVHESFSGDGPIVASHEPADSQIPMSSIGRKTRESSLFGSE